MYKYRRGRRLKGVIIMVEKNKKKEEAKKHRQFWHLDPRTKIVQSKKKYNRQKFKKGED